MLLQRRERLPEGADWMYEIELDGYRAPAIKTEGKVLRRSRDDNDFTLSYPGIVKALAGLPNETVVDGEVVALDHSGKPSFNALQNYGSCRPEIFCYVFDLLILAGYDVMPEPLTHRRALLQKRVLPKLQEPIRYSGELMAPLPVLISSVKAQGLEGIVAKRRHGVYEPGLRSGTWQKMRGNKGQEFVIGGYTPSDKNFDTLISTITKRAASSILVVPATVSLPPSERKSRSGSAPCKLPSALWLIFPRSGADVGDRA